MMQTREIFLKQCRSLARIETVVLTKRFNSCHLLLSQWGLVSPKKYEKIIWIMQEKKTFSFPNKLQVLWIK